MADTKRGWVNYVRNSRPDSRPEASDRSFTCPVCAADVAPDLDSFRQHIRNDGQKHAALVGDADIEQAFTKMTLSPKLQ